MMLKNYLLRYNLTQEEFAKKIGVTRTSVSKYINQPKKTNFLVRAAIELITAGEVRRDDW